MVANTTSWGQINGWEPAKSDVKKSTYFTTTIVRTELLSVKAQHRGRSLI
jgi:hypothetical protein